MEKALDCGQAGTGEMETQSPHRKDRSEQGRLCTNSARAGSKAAGGERSRHPKAVGFTAITNCRCIHWALTECRSFSHIFPAMEPCYREGNQGSENPKVTQERPGIRTQVWTQDWPQRPNSYPRAAGHGSAWMPDLCSRERCGLRASGQDLSLGVGPVGSPAAGLTLPEMEPRSEH